MRYMGSHSVKHNFSSLDIVAICSFISSEWTQDFVWQIAVVFVNSVKW